MREISFFGTTTAPYYIFGLDYSQKSAGQRALHYLCHALNELGYEAYITSEVTHPGLRTPPLTRRVERLQKEAGRIPIVVYPEVVSGNPLSGTVVVRWLLNQPGHLSGDRYHDDNDLVFTYSPAFLPTGMESPVLHVPTVDTAIFNNRDNPHDGERDLICYYANKYLAKGGRLTHHVKAAVSLGQEIQLDQGEIAATLRRARLLYIYEPTALMNEALLCGCPVCVIVSDYWKSNTGNKVFAPDIGIAMADTSTALAEASRTVSNYAEMYGNNIKLAWAQLKRFIAITQRRADEVRRHAAPAPLTLADERVAVASDIGSYYSLWLSTHRDPVSVKPQLSGMAELAASQGVFHIVIPVLEGYEGRLAGTLDSLASQSYPFWRASILSTRDQPAEFADRTGIRWVKLAVPAYAQAYNQLIEEEDFGWLLTLEAGDTLEQHALSEIATHATKQAQWGIVYVDEDSIDDSGLSDRPYFKPDYLIDFHRAAPYALSAGIAVKRQLLRELSGFNIDAEGAENYDLVLRAWEHLGGRGIGHLTDVLYHRSDISGHCTLTQDEVIAVRRRVLQEHLVRTGVLADVDDGVLPGTFRIRYHLDGEDLVSIIVPTLNAGTFLQRCVGALMENTDYKNWELIIVDKESDEADTCAFLDSLVSMQNDALHVLSMPRSTSLPEMINAGARRARGKYLLFMSDATAPLQGCWLEEMLGYAVQPGVGVVGAKMIGLDSNISFSGYILGLGGRPAGLHDLHQPPDAFGYFGCLQVPGNPSAVSANCMLTEKALFDSLGGFDEEHLAGGYSDVDYCLRVAEAGRRIVWTPFALLLQEHTTPAPEVVEDEHGNEQIADHKPKGRASLSPSEKIMFDRWLNKIAFDPAYNRNLTLTGQPFDIEIAPWLTQDPDFRPLPRILAHPGDRNGCGEYRIIAPLRAMVNAGKVQGWDTMLHLSIPELERLSPDTLILQRQISWDHINVMEEYLRYTKALRVYELDDLITNVQLNNQLRKNVASKDLIKRFRKALSLCDRFIVATDYLAQEYRSFNSDIRVVPNYLERAVWGDLTSKRRQGRKPRVGWAGSVSHDGDLAIIKDVVLATKDEVEWVFMGLCPEGVRQFVEYKAFISIEEYPEKLASLNLDLAIAPLEDVPFNHAKSHLRLLEYGILGWPVICSDITPYRGDFPVTRVKNRYRDWLDAVRSHVADLDALAKQGDALRNHVENNWMLENHLENWLRAWLP